jgi:hypothetical protein
MKSRHLLQQHTLLICMAAASHCVIAYADDSCRQRQVIPHKENRKDPYVPRSPQPPAAETLMATTSGPYPSVQVNLDELGNNILDDAANEPSIAVDPLDPTRMAIGWRQFDNIASNFRQAGVGHSIDGGLTWTASVIDAGNFRSDPILGADLSGKLHYYSLSTLSSCELFNSDDGGASWSDPVLGFGGDKAWLAVDVSNTPGQGHIYAKWQIFFGCCDGTFTRSIDGGLSFEEPVPVPLEPGFGTIAAGPDGEVYVVGVQMDEGFQDYDSIVIARSTDTWDASITPSFDWSTNVDLGGGLGIGEDPNPNGLVGQIVVKVDHSVQDTRGNVYMLGSVDPPGPDPLDVMFIRSEDGGVTWNDPIRVNDVEDGWQWFGSLAVAPNGRLDAVWNDTRDTGAANLSRLYYAYSMDAGNTWSPNMAISPVFDSHIGWPSQNKLGDYYDMISHNATASLAYAATFNGEQDVYYLRIGDCNNNDIHDGLEVDEGITPDCNNNRIPDDCESIGEFVRDSGNLSPIGNGAPQQYVLENIPVALGDVTISLSASADLAGATEVIEVRLNDNDLGDFFVDAEDCPDDADTDVVQLSAEQFNALAPAGSAVVDLISSSNVSADQCNNPESTISVSIHYPAEGADCNDNGILDTCELVDGTATDCNGNAVLDECEIETVYAAASPELGPLGSGDPQSHIFVSPPRALSDVTLTIRAFADLSTATESLDVQLNGHDVDEIFDDDGEDCSEDLVTVVTIPAYFYNLWVGAGDAQFTAIASNSVSSGQCDPTSYVVFNVSYDMAGNDCDGNGEVDACQLADGTLADCDGNGIADACELSTLFTAHSEPLSPVSGGSTLQFGAALAPLAAFDVTVTVAVVADLGASSEVINVALNSLPIGTLFVEGSDCPGHPDIASIVVPAEQFNAVNTYESLGVLLAPSNGVNGTQCDPESYATISVAYETLGNDCNDNGVLDTCDIGSGAILDCNGNGRPDDCEIDGIFHATTGPLAPIGDGPVYQLALQDPPPATGVVTLDLQALAELAGDRYIQVTMDGALLANAWEGRGENCSSLAEQWAIDAGAFNATAQDGEVVFLFAPDSGMHPTFCGPVEFLTATVTYPIMGGDCNTNSVLDECDLADGTSSDCNDNGLPDECDALVGDDCNANQVPDNCDVESGTSSDCNGNGHPDECELDTTFVVTSEILSPIGGDFPQTFAILDPFMAFSDVTMTLTASGDLGSPTERVDVEINGSFIGSVFGPDGTDCPDDPDIGELIIPVDTYNSAIAGADEAIIDLVPTFIVNTDQCTPPSFIQVRVEHAGVEVDCNENDTLDECDLANGTSTDFNNNGIPDECDPPPITIVSSAPPDGAIDARQPSDVDGANPAGWDTVMLTFNESADELTLDHIEILSTAEAVPQISTMVIEQQVVTLTLDQVVPLGACTTIRHLPSQSQVRLSYLPGDANSDAQSGPLDILALIDELNGVHAPNMQPWQCDANRSGLCEPLDILRIIDLINGAGVYDAWNGIELPECL